MRKNGIDGYLAAVGMAAVALVLSAPFQSAPYARFFGTAPAFAVLPATMVLGLILLPFLVRMRWVSASIPTGKELVGIVILASLFAAPTIAVDWIAPFGADINAPLPVALAFYPAIAFLVEVVFHLLPLAILAGIAWLAGADPRWFLPAALLVALAEPVFQVIFGATPDAPLWRDVYLVVHLFAFSLVQLWLLRHKGFLGALAFRLVYYGWWHIIWGWLRLDLIFGP